MSSGMWTALGVPAVVVLVDWYVMLRYHHRFVAHQTAALLSERCCTCSDCLKFRHPDDVKRWRELAGDQLVE